MSSIYETLNKISTIDINHNKSQILINLGKQCFKNDKFSRLLSKNINRIINSWHFNNDRCKQMIKQSIDMEKKRKFIGKLIEKFEWFVHG